MSSIFTVPELAIGVGLSEAASAAFEPKVEVPKQSAWVNNPQRVPDLGLIAALVAGGKVLQESGHNMANRLGFSNGTMDSITWLAQNRLDFAAMLRLWRLFPDYVTPHGVKIADLVDETLAHEQLDWNYHELLTKLKHAELPGIGDIAYGVVRGMLPAPKWVPVAPPASGDYVPRFPRVEIDPLKLAHALGFDEDMLKLMVGRSGLSMAPIMAANALFRSSAAGELDGLPDVPGVAPFRVKPYVGPQDFLLAIAEGDLRTEWADAVKETAREILTAGQYAELELRGYVDRKTRRALTAQHGMSHFDSDLLYDVQGRGLSLHQSFIGQRRLKAFGVEVDKIPDWAMFSLQRGNLRPEVYKEAFAGRHTLPSAFVVRALLTGGAISAADGEDLFLWMGWPEHLATKVAKHYAPSGAAVADPHVTKADNQLWTAQHTAYVKGRSDDAFATETLQELGASAAAIPIVLARWQRERAIRRAGLTAAQIKKGYSESAVNDATGAPWTRDEAVAALMELGSSSTEAASYLNL